VAHRRGANHPGDRESPSQKQGHWPTGTCVKKEIEAKDLPHWKKTRFNKGKKLAGKGPVWTSNRKFFSQCYASSAVGGGAKSDKGDAEGT